MPIPQKSHWVFDPQPSSLEDRPLSAVNREGWGLPFITFATLRGTFDTLE